MSNVMIRRSTSLLAFFLYAGAASFSYAGGGGLQNANLVMQNFIQALQLCAVAAATIAILWVGYKCLFQGANWSDYSRVLVGALLLGSAGALAQMLGV